MKVKKAIKIQNKSLELIKQLKEVVKMTKNIIYNHEQSQKPFSLKTKNESKTSIVRKIVKGKKEWVLTKDVMFELVNQHPDIPFVSKNVSAMLCNMVTDGLAEKMSTDEGIKYKIIK